MKLTIDRLRLLKVLSIVGIAIGQKSPTPAFLNYKFVITNDELSITGSNNDLTIVSVIPVKENDETIITSITPGATLISSKFLLEIIRKLEGKYVTIEVIDEVLARISDEKSDFKLNSMRVEDYPDLDLSIEGKKITFNVDEYKKIVAQTSFAASNKEVRPILTAVNVKGHDDKIEFTATDSFRLSKKTVSYPNVEEFEANIPVKTLIEVAKMVENKEVSLFISDKKVVFEYQDTKIYSRLIAGDFPKTSRMIPSTYPYVLEINAEKFISAMSRVSLLAIERENIVKITINQDELEIISKSDQIGSAKEIIDDYKFAGDRFDISFNVNYVIDSIKATQCEEVTLSFAGEMSAFRVTATKDDSIVQVVTPVRSYY